MKITALFSVLCLAAMMSGGACAPAVPPESPENAPEKTPEKAPGKTPEKTPEVALSIALTDASLRDVLPALVQAWADQQDDAPQVEVIFSNLGTISAKLTQKAPWDLVVLADTAETRALTEKALLRREGQKNIAKNDLVVYGRKALLTDEEPDWYDLVKDEWKKFAMGHPQMTASGRAAQAAIRKHSLEDRVKADVFTPGSENVAFDYARRNEVDAVFLYKTDLRKGKIEGFEVYPVEPGDYPPILYTAAITTSSTRAAAAKSLIDFLVSESAHPIWLKFGFGGQ